jgi:hypothetical protein
VHGFSRRDLQYPGHSENWCSLSEPLQGLTASTSTAIPASNASRPSRANVVSAAISGAKRRPLPPNVSEPALPANEVSGPSRANAVSAAVPGVDHFVQEVQPLGLRRAGSRVERSRCLQYAPTAFPGMRSDRGEAAGRALSSSEGGRDLSPAETRLGTEPGLLGSSETFTNCSDQSPADSVTPPVRSSINC